MDGAHGGVFVGAFVVVSSFLGSLTWPTLVRWGTGRGRKDALVTVFAAGLTVSWICVAMVGLTRSSTVLLTAIGVGTFLSAALPVLAPLLIQLVPPGRDRQSVL